MRVNAEKVLSLRKENSWSQEELAITAGLNLRTVQRIEKDGSASLQSKKALAAAFEIEAVELDYKETMKMIKYEYQTLQFDVKFKGAISLKVKTEFSQLDKELNELGAEGWDLVSLVGIDSDGGYTIAVVATLKRVIAEE